MVQPAMQAWDGSVWKVLKSIAGNSQRVNTIDLASEYLTDKIRVYIPVAYNADYGIPAGVAEFTAYKYDLVDKTEYIIGTLSDGNYQYEVSAVDIYGSESSRTASEVIPIGDVLPPSPPGNLTATTMLQNVNLQWNAPESGDATTYNVYRQSSEGWIRINGAAIASLTFTQTNAANGAYVYRVTALDAQGNESGPSNEVTAVVAVDPPARPSGPVVEVLP
jgi:hypothetical protein